MWGGPTPHNLVTLCLCYAGQTCSEVPISSSNRDTIWKGGETAFSFPRSSLPRCRVVITQREVLIRLGILPDANAIKSVQRHWGIPSRIWRPWGQDPCLHWHLSVGCQEEYGTGQQTSVPSTRPKSQQKDPGLPTLRRSP